MKAEIRLTDDSRVVVCVYPETLLEYEHARLLCILDEAGEPVGLRSKRYARVDDRMEVVEIIMGPRAPGAAA